jgi:hypothetical protein
VMHVAMGVHTCISERVGVDCSCFSIDGHHFSARSSAEKAFWLRAISNVKVKLRHRAENPSPQELAHYRTSVADGARFLRDGGLPQMPVLQRRERQGGTQHGGKEEKEDSSTQSPDRIEQFSDAGSSTSPNKGGPGQQWGSGGLKVPKTPAPLAGTSPPGSPPPSTRPPACEEPPQCDARPPATKPTKQARSASPAAAARALCGPRGTSPRSEGMAPAKSNSTGLDDLGN